MVVLYLVRWRLVLWRSLFLSTSAPTGMTRWLAARIIPYAFCPLPATWFCHGAIHTTLREEFRYIRAGSNAGSIMGTLLLDSLRKAAGGRHFRLRAHVLPLLRRAAADRGSGAFLPLRGRSAAGEQPR